MFSKQKQHRAVKELTIIFKPRLSAPYVEQIVAKLRGLHIVAQPIRFVYPLSVSLIAEQVQNLHETKENHMLIPIFHSLLLCSPKEGITKGMSSFSLYLYEKLLLNSSSRCIWSKRNLNFALV
jgi:hypothetical protein